MGVGKTSMVSFLRDRYGLEPVYEPFTDNPYLDLFYEDMGRWAFRSQLYFLTHKFRLHMQLTSGDRAVVQDRTIYEDAEIFAAHLHQRGWIDDRDFGLYNELYETMRAAVQSPDLLIYLRCSVPAIRRRIKRRGRAAEQDIPTRYLKSLNTLYEGWVARYDLSPVVIWNSDRMDYLSDLVDRMEFHQLIDRFL